MRQRIIIFVSLLLGLGALFFWRVFWPLHVVKPLFWGASSLYFFGFLALLWMPLYFWTSDSDRVSAGELFLERTAHVTMGVLSFILLTMVIREFASIWVPALRGARGSLVVLASALTLYGLGFFFAMRGPVVRKVKFTPSVQLPPGFSLRLVQVSDLHVGTWIRRGYVERVRNRIQKLGEIDLFLLTGDIGDGAPSERRGDLAPIGEVQARLGRFSVTGNHEGYWSETGWNAEIEALGFRVLENESARVEKSGIGIAVAGIPDLRSDVARACAELRPTDLNLFLAHQPYHAAEAEKFPVHLQLSGHTHAGQFLPWSWFIGLFHRHAKGLHREGRFAIYVNPGTGFWGSPLRLGTRSEITLIEIG